MEKIFFNDDNLTKEEIDETVIRLKALILNSKNELLLGYSYNTYQFPGGHLEEGESLLDGLKRELKEETGIIFDVSNLEPFQEIRYYSKNYRNTGKNRENIIYYYLIRSDKDYDLSNTNYDTYEIRGNYKLVRVKISEIERILKNSVMPNNINELIVKEMLIALNNSGILNG